MDLEQRITEYHRHRQHHRRHNPTRAQLVALIEFLFELVEYLLDRLAHQHHNHQGVIVQVQITDQQKVRLHAVEVNAEDQPVNQDTATCSWATDRTDLVTLVDVPTDDGTAVDSFAIDVDGIDGATGDATVTATITEPDVDNGDGTSNPGVVYTATQVVSVGPDEQIAAVDIVADAPEPK